MSIDSASSAMRLNVERVSNFMRQFRDPDSRELKKLSANQFMEIWSHYDKDGQIKPFSAYTRGHAKPSLYRPLSSLAPFHIGPERLSIERLRNDRRCNKATEGLEPKAPHSGPVRADDDHRRRRDDDPRKQQLHVPPEARFNLTIPVTGQVGPWLGS
ncbi:Calbindin-32 [Eumeta japonica]|uniref:Calbindin-32 n=1 Tax=Eumeta variegata TaxID=151549 RepID=A0A4C1VCW9_EUMVA|nr:Calbindin-32 [Eumeta japonica]